MILATVESAFNPAFLLGVYAVLLGLELPLALIAWRNGSRRRALAVPAVLFVAAILTPNDGAKLGLLAGSLFGIFGIAIVGRFRRTHRDETDFLADYGPSLWPPKRRQQSRNLLVIGLIWAVTAIVVEGMSGHRTIATVLLFPTGSLMVGLSLVRSHAVLVTYFGRGRARWLELVQSISLIAAYVLVFIAESSSDPGSRTEMRILSLLPLGVHFLFVWLPLARTQEQYQLSESTGRYGANREGLSPPN